MNINLINRNILVALNIAMLLIMFGCSSTQNIVSSYNDTIILDGNRNDWSNSLIYNEDNNLSVGFTNDNKNLYISVIASQRSSVMKILNMGLIVWLESLDSDEKIGIRFPHKLEDNKSNMVRLARSINNEPIKDMELMLHKLIVQQDEVSIVNEDGFPLYAFNRKSAEGIAAVLDYKMGQLVYELRVPLAENNLSPFVFNAQLGSTIFVTIESGKMSRKITSGRSSGGMGEGSMRGGRSGGGRSGGKMGRAGNRLSNVNDNMKPINFRAEVMLSKNQ